MKDQLEKLVQIQVIETELLTRQVVNRDSVIELSTMELRQTKGLCKAQTDSVALLLKGEAKRRRGNGLWRDVFIGTTVFLIYLIAKP